MNANAAVKAPLIEQFCDLVVRAGQLILDVRERGVHVIAKSDDSPVTEADRGAEAIILDGLRDSLPDLPVVAEEAVSAGRCPESLGNRFILVDPLDGTREFIAGRPDFTVNIALIEKGVPVAGVVYAPMRRALYLADAGRAFKRMIAADGTPASEMAIACRPYHQPPCIVASKSHLTPETVDFIARHPEATTCAIGSSLKFCLVAEGEADLYPRFGRTMEWDTAAGDAVLRAAGGDTVRLDGTPFVYGKQNQPNDVDFANPFFIAASLEGLGVLDFRPD